MLKAGGVKKILKKIEELQNVNQENYEARHHVTACGAVLNLSFDNGTVPPYITNYITKSYMHNNCPTKIGSDLTIKVSLIKTCNIVHLFKNFCIKLRFDTIEW